MGWYKVMRQSAVTQRINSSTSPPNPPLPPTQRGGDDKPTVQHPQTLRVGYESVTVNPFTAMMSFENDQNKMCKI